MLETFTRGISGLSHLEQLGHHLGQPLINLQIAGSEPQFIIGRGDLTSQFKPFGLEHSLLFARHESLPLRFEAQFAKPGKFLGEENRFLGHGLLVELPSVGRQVQNTESNTRIFQRTGERDLILKALDLGLEALNFFVVN